MPTARELLRGRAAYLMNAGAWVLPPFGLVSLLYCQLTFTLPAGAWVPLVGFAVVAPAALIPLSRRYLSTGLKTLDAVAKGRAPPTPTNLQRVAREVAAFPDRTLKATTVEICAAVGAMVLTDRLLVAAFDLAWMGRLASALLIPMPLGLVLCHIVCTRRARAVLATLPAAWLPLAQLLDALPSSRRRFQFKFMVLASVLLLTPALTTWDAARTALHRQVARVRAAATRDDGALAAAELSLAEATRSVAVLSGLALVAGLVAAYFAARSIGEPLATLGEAATRLAQGDLREPAVVPAEDELWALSGSFLRLVGQFAGVLGEMKKAGLRIGTATEQLLQVSTRSESGANDQAASVHETNATTEELARVAQQIAQSSEAVWRTAGRTLTAARESQSSSVAFIGSMEKMRQDTATVADSVVALNQRVQQIGRIAEFINGIADKADLLALNAELEGTKAGDVGRGFSLVAAEMRRLAENVLRSTGEIEQLIFEIRQATRAAVTASEAGLKTTDAGVRQARQVFDNLGEILTLADETSTAAAAITQATQQQQGSSAQLAEAMARVLHVTEQNVQATQQVAGSSTDLAALARELQGVVDRFRAG